MIAKGKYFASGVAFANRDFNLGSAQMFEIVRSQKEASDENSRNQIINLITKFCKAEFRCSLVKERRRNRINENLNDMSMEKLKNFTK